MCVITRQLRFVSLRALAVASFSWHGSAQRRSCAVNHSAVFRDAMRWLELWWKSSIPEKQPPAKHKSPTHKCLRIDREGASLGPAGPRMNTRAPENYRFAACVLGIITFSFTCEKKKHKHRMLSSDKLHNGMLLMMMLLIHGHSRTKNAGFYSCYLIRLSRTRARRITIFVIVCIQHLEDLKRMGRRASQFQYINTDRNRDGRLCVFLWDPTRVN